MLYEIYVSYLDKVYSNGLNKFAKFFIPGVETFNISDVEAAEKDIHDIINVCSLKETPEIVSLHINKLQFNTNLLEFCESPLVTYTFNKLTSEGSIDNENIDLTHFDFERNSIRIVANYLGKVCETNNNVSNFVSEHLSERCFNLRYSNSFSTKDENLLRLFTMNIIEIEKLITSNNIEFLLDLLKTKDAKLEKGKKIYQVIAIPKFGLEFMNENDLLSAKTTIQKIANDYDGNTLRIIIDMFNAFKPYEKYDSKRYGYGNNNPVAKKRRFLENMDYLLDKKYKVVDLLNYLLKQRMYWSENNFDCPYDEASLLVDYLDICEKYKLKVEKYPQNLKKNHDIVLKNIKILNLNDETKERFKTAVSKYYTKDITVGDYVFTAPQNIPHLVSEGDELHHCIGNYTTNIIEGISKIYFMRKVGEENKPYITLELDSRNDLVEFKGDYNKEPSEVEVLDALKDFVKIIKKTGGK